MYASFVCSKLKNSDEKNQRRPKQMERYTMFMDWNTCIIGPPYPQLPHLWFVESANVEPEDTEG